MEDLVMGDEFWRGRRVFVTGHTGFKGGWLCLWLSRLGAEVHGFSLSPAASPSLFEVAGVQDVLASHCIGDVRDIQALRESIRAAGPEIVFHMAAQSLVRLSYASPIETYAVNVMGTANILEVLREQDGVEAFVNVTTDKCYDNKEWVWGYRENEALGGHDPYSSSKACSELVTSAYRGSFFHARKPWIASARAGNVIGGGDWALDRLVPDALRSLNAGEPLTIRSPNATRPWQHVLEPLSGYMLLAQSLVERGEPYAKAWNFGPSDQDARSVQGILERMQNLCPELNWRVDGAPVVHEANYLKLDSSMAASHLGWRSRWSVDVALDKTVAWDRAWRSGAEMASICLDQIDEYAGQGS